MRENYKLMASLANETRLQTGKRMEKLLSFNRRLNGEPPIKKELSEWNLQLDNKLFDVPARQLPPETIYFGKNMFVAPERGDWTQSMKNKSCVISPKLTDWVFIITERDKHLKEVLLDLY